MGNTSFKGKTSQRLSIRPPIAVTVLSMTLSSELPSSCIGDTSSNERIVKRSRRTYFSSSMRDSEVMWLICVCWVSSRYCNTAPLAMIPFFKWSTPKPLSDFVPKCFSSFWRALWSEKTQSSISNTQYFVPKKRSKSFLCSRL